MLKRGLQKTKKNWTASLRDNQATSVFPFVPVALTSVLPLKLLFSASASIFVIVSFMSRTTQGTLRIFKHLRYHGLTTLSHFSGHVGRRRGRLACRTSRTNCHRTCPPTVTDVHRHQVFAQDHHHGWRTSLSTGTLKTGISGFTGGSAYRRIHSCNAPRLLELETWEVAERGV